MPFVSAGAAFAAFSFGFCGGLSFFSFFSFLARSGTAFGVSVSAMLGGCFRRAVQFGVGSCLDGGEIVKLSHRFEVSLDSKAFLNSKDGIRKNYSFHVCI